MQIVSPVCRMDTCSNGKRTGTQLMGIYLLHDKVVLLPFEDLNLVKDSQIASSEVPLAKNRHTGTPLPVHAQPGCLLLVCVGVHNQWKPKSFNVLLVESVERSFLFEVLIGGPALFPLESAFKL